MSFAFDQSEELREAQQRIAALEQSPATKETDYLLLAEAGRVLRADLAESQKAVAALEEENAELRRKLAERAKDTERMNWLDRLKTTEFGTGHCAVEVRWTISANPKFNSIREVVDAARQEQKEQGR